MGGPLFELPTFVKMTNTDPFAAWFVVAGNATLNGIRVVFRVFCGVLDKSNVSACFLIHHTANPEPQTTQ